MSIASSFATTIEDYETVATNYRIVELIQGDIIVTPPPTIKHQKIIKKLTVILDRLLGDEGEIFFSPIGVKTENNEVFEPDLLYISKTRRDIIKENYIEGAPDLVVEVLSPSTRHRDLNIKKSKYHQLSVVEYWIIDGETDELIIFDRSEEEFEVADTFDLKNDTIKSTNFPIIQFRYE